MLELTLMLESSTSFLNLLKSFSASLLIGKFVLCLNNEKMLLFAHSWLSGGSAHTGVNWLAIASMKTAKTVIISILFDMTIFFLAAHTPNNANRHRQCKKPQPNASLGR